ncbi:MAG TPA: type III-A CRISPR-associated RAMP protein Csm4 [Flavilitoribacter sp.]|nr:type III-A CRISPR-associated RAMP protein Csm4 [Flavilitoribacter sp.]
MKAVNFIVYRLHFHTPLHIGDKRPDDYSNSQGYIHSDTLYAAVLATWARQGADIPANGRCGFQVSSLFPFSQNESGETRYFFPRPMADLPFDGDRVSIAKGLKKIQWLDQHYFEKVLQREPIADFGNDLQDEFCSRSQLGNPIYVRQMSQRVAIPRDRNQDADPRPFYMERLIFAERAGLYFLFEGDEDARQKLESALDLLQFEGFGTDRTIGNGLFTWESGGITLRLPDPAEYAINLSLFCPESRKELTGMMDANARFDLVKRGGWMTSPGYQSIRKQSVYMFREGGIWRTTRSVAGAPAIDLRPGSYPVDHPVWRNGSGIFLPIKISGYGI